MEKSEGLRYLYDFPNDSIIEICYSDGRKEVFRKKNNEGYWCLELWQPGGKLREEFGIEEKVFPIQNVIISKTTLDEIIDHGIWCGNG